MAKTAASAKGRDAETAGMRSEIEALAATREKRREGVASLGRQVGEGRKGLAGRKKVVRERRAWVEGMRERDVEELRFWEEALGVRMEGTGREEGVRFVFALERGREASFELEMGRRYEVWRCVPGLEARWEVVQGLCRGMEEREELGVLLKGMRGLFLEVMG